ncbi:helix-turn-helix transcriptional regulator [Salibacterium sp. K-3]
MNSLRRERLIEARKKLGLTQKDVVSNLHKETGIEITESYYGMIEQGVRTPSLKLALPLSKIVREDPESIFFNNEHNKKLGKTTSA